MDAITAGLLAEPAKQAIKPLYEKFLEPQLGKVKDWFKEKDLDYQESIFESKCIEYISRTHDKCSVINTLVFPNQQIKIEKIYQPLRIIAVGGGESHMIDNTQLDFLKTYRKILIRDQAGMGKSTLMRWIVCKIIDNYIGIPVFIELRKISGTNKIIDEISNQFNQIGKAFDKDLLLRLISNGHFIFILDGYDEIVPSEQGKVVDDIVEFSSKARNNYFIMTSRPESSLSSFGDFKAFNIANLSKQQYTSIINKCDEISGFEIASNLIADLDKKRNQVKGFLRNPFLVTLLYKVYFYNKNIPLKKAAFYEEIYQALYKHHDLSKDRFERPKKSALDIYQFRQVLRRFAFQTAKDGLVEYTNVQLMQYVEKARVNSVGLPNFSDSSFVEDIIQHVPLFEKDGLSIKWIHKSLQDYFAAEYIAFANKKEDILNNIYKNNLFYKYANVIDFISEIDYSIFRNTMLYSAVKEFIEFYDASKENYKRFSKEDIETRISMLFGAECYISDGVRDDELLDRLARLHVNEGILDYNAIYNDHTENGLVFAVACTKTARLIFDFASGDTNEDLFLDRSKPVGKSSFEEDVVTISEKVNGKIIFIKTEGREFYNNSVYFSKVNNVYCYLMGTNKSVINYERCRIVKEDIEKRKIGGADGDDSSGL